MDTIFGTDVDRFKYYRQVKKLELNEDEQDDIEKQAYLDYF